MNKHLKLFLKIAFSILLLALLISNSQINEAINVALEFDYKYMAVCVFIYLIGQFISAYRWKLLSSLLNFNLSTVEHYKYYLIGMYFNLFLPSTIGGDVSKAYYMANGGTKARYLSATYSIIADRATGLIVLVWLACIGLYLPIGNTLNPIFKTLFTIGVLLSLGILPILPILVKPLPMKYKDALRKFLGELKVFWKSPMIIFQTFVWSTIFHLIIVWIHVLIGDAMGLNLPFTFYLIAYPVVSIISFIPISFNGIGVREGFYVYLFAKVGVDSHIAIVFSIFYFAITVISSIIGGYVYLRTKSSKNKLIDYNLENGSLE